MYVLGVAKYLEIDTLSLFDIAMENDTGHIYRVMIYASLPVK